MLEGRRCGEIPRKFRDFLFGEVDQQTLGHHYHAAGSSSQLRK